MTTRRTLLNQVKCLAFWFTVTLLSCSRREQAPSPDVQLIGRDALRQFLVVRGVHNDAITEADPLYYEPSIDWIKGDFSTQLQLEQRRAGVSQYENPANDCAKFSRFAATYAATLFFHTPGRPPGAGLAFGEFWYITDTGTAHAINCIVANIGGKPELVFYEPQAWKIVPLSANEVLHGIARF